MSSKYSIATAIAKLKRKKVFFAEKKIVVCAEHDVVLGNGSWGAIDFLMNHCGYVLIRENLSRSRRF